MDSTFALVAVIVTIALLFDYTNGFHDAANSIATIVSTRVLRPQHAVAWAAFFNFIAFLIFGAHVAQTVGTGIVSADIVDPRVVFAALVGAIAWNIITWAMGIPSSSSHALIGGLVGAGVAKVGVKAIVWEGLAKTSAAIILSPVSSQSPLKSWWSWGPPAMCVLGPPVVLGMNRIVSSPAFKPGPDMIGARNNPSTSTRAVSYASTGIALGHSGGLSS